MALITGGDEKNARGGHGKHQKFTQICEQGRGAGRRCLSVGSRLEALLSGCALAGSAGEIISEL
jgi:hypothetical protein